MELSERAPEEPVADGPAADEAFAGEAFAGEAFAGELACGALDARVGVLSAQLHAVAAELVDAVAAFAAAGGGQVGFSSLSQWLSVRGGFSRAEAVRLVALAGRVDELPTLMAHARAGRLSTGVVSMAARVVDEHNEAAVADIVVATTPAQAARVLSRYRSVRDADAPDPDPAAPTGDDATDGTTGGEARVRELDTWWRCWSDEAGRGRIDAALSPDVAALVHQAWAAAAAAGEADRATTEPAEPTAPTGVDVDADTHHRLGPDEIAARWATTMLDHAHDHGLCHPGGERHGVLVDIDVATLARVLGTELDPTLPIGLGTRAFDSRTGAHLADHDLARMLCDTDIQVLVHHDGVPLWMSKPTRTANRHQRRALQFRSGGGCEYPGCTQTRYLDAHHVRYWSLGGATTIDNMVLLCSHHHRALHRGDYRITATGDQRFTFTDQHGQHLGTTTTATGAHGPPPAITRRPRIEHPPDPPAQLGADTACSHTHGERLTPYALDIYLTHLLAA